MVDKTSLFSALDSIGGGALTTLISAAMGRLMWHSNEVRKKRRKFWSRELLFEIPMVLGMALIGEGISSYFNISGQSGAMVIGLISYLGPRGIEASFFKWLDRRNDH